VSYVEQNLNPGESVLYSTHLHWIVLIRSILADTVFSVAGVGLLFWGIAGKHTERGEAQAAEIAGFPCCSLEASFWRSQSSVEMPPKWP